MPRESAGVDERLSTVGEGIDTPTRRHLQWEKSMKSPAAYSGQHNLKGKKTARLSCRCCTMFNFKDKLDKQRHKKEMRDAIKCVSE